MGLGLGLGLRLGSQSSVGGLCEVRLDDEVDVVRADGDGRVRAHDGLAVDLRVQGRRWRRR